MSSSTTTNEAVSSTATIQPQETATTTGASMTPIPIQHNAHVTPMSKPLNPPAATDEIHRLAFTAELEMEAILKCWDPIALTSVLNILNSNDFPLQILMKYQLGRLIKAINKKAQRTENKPIMDASEKIMVKWHKLLPSEGHTPTSSPTPSPSPLSSPKEAELVTFKQTSPPLAASQAQPTKPAPFRLAIQKDPPPKPKAVTNTSFFDKLKGPFSTSSTVRPSFAKQRPPTSASATDMLNKYQHNKQTAVPSPISSPTNPALSFPLGSPTNAAYKKRPFELVSSSSTTTSSSSTVGAPEKIPRKAKTKRVRFKPDHQLTTTREYEKDPEEWNFDQTEGTGFLGVMHVDQARNLDINEGQVLSQAHHPQQHQQQPLPTGTKDPRFTQLNNQPMHQLHQQQTFSWYSPRALMIPESCRMPWPKQSSEAVAQKERERVTLAAVYTSLSHVPPTPTEPDEPAVPNDYPPVIPLQDVNANSMESYSQLQQDQQQQGVSQQAMQQGINYGFVSSPASLPNQPVHLLHPYQPPQQEQYAPQQQVPSVSAPQYTSYVPQPQVPATSGTIYQQSQPVTSQQPQHTNEQMNILMNSGLLGAISEMVRNLTPPSGAAPPPQTGAPPQQQQQPYPYPYITTSMPPQPSYSQPTASRPQFAHQYPKEFGQQLDTNSPPTPTTAPINTNTKQQRAINRNQSPKQRKRKRKALRDADRFLRPCKFYNTPTGCVTGDSCPFKHIN